MRITGFYVYRIYLTYKTHFNTKSFDVAKYQYNLLNPSYDKFIDVKGKVYFDTIAERLKKEKEVTNLFIAAFMDDPSLWIRDIVVHYSHFMELKTIWEGRLANLPYLFKKDCLYLIERGLKFDQGLGEFVFGEFTNANISLETFIIFKKIFNFSLDNNTLFGYTYTLQYEKYESLLVLDKERYKLILKEALMASRD